MRLSRHADDPGQTLGRVDDGLIFIALNRGDYSIIAFVGDENAITVFDRRDVRPAFSISGERYDVGLISVDHRWSLQSVAAEAAVVER